MDVQQQSAGTASDGMTASDLHRLTDLRQRPPPTFRPLDGKEVIQFELAISHWAV
jgi:hypothetical protein